MAEFLDTTAISYHIERLLKTAEHRVIVISPYLKFRLRIRELIQDCVERGVLIEIIYGKNRQCNETDRLMRLSNVRVLFCKTVHAKCYLNEGAGIITSLNLYDFSEAKNYEMGVLFNRSSDANLFRQVVEEAERLIRIARGGDLDIRARQRPCAVGVLKPADHMEKLTTGRLATKLGLTSKVLYEKLIGCGYLEIGAQGNHYITDDGKKVGGEFRFGKGPYFLWPTNLSL